MYHNNILPGIKKIALAIPSEVSIRKDYTKNNAVFVVGNFETLPIAGMGAMEIVPEQVKGSLLYTASVSARMFDLDLSRDYNEIPIVAKVVDVYNNTYIIGGKTKPLAECKISKLIEDKTARYRNISIVLTAPQQPPFQY